MERAYPYTWPGSNWRPSACEADVIATRPQVRADDRCRYSRMTGREKWAGDEGKGMCVRAFAPEAENLLLPPPPPLSLGWSYVTGMSERPPPAMGGRVSGQGFCDRARLPQEWNDGTHATDSERRLACSSVASHAAGVPCSCAQRSQVALCAEPEGRPHLNFAFPSGRQQDSNLQPPAPWIDAFLAQWATGIGKRARLPMPSREVESWGGNIACFPR